VRLRLANVRERAASCSAIAGCSPGCGWAARSRTRPFTRKTPFRRTWSI